MATEQEIEHCPEAQEVLGKIPGWTVRWGLAVIFLFFLCLLAGCYFIRYPQVLKVPLIPACDHEADHGGGFRVCVVVPFASIGKVAVGQTVRRIQIGQNPREEDEMLTGTISSISDNPVAEGYPVCVALSPRCKVARLRFPAGGQQSLGTGEIVLSESSLLEHLLRSIRQTSSLP